MPKHGISGNPAAARKHARRAAAEKRMARYIPLLCGHFGDYDTDVFYSPIPRGKHYCQKCRTWEPERKNNFAAREDTGSAAYTSESPEY